MGKQKRANGCRYAFISAHDWCLGKIPSLKVKSSFSKQKLENWMNKRSLIVKFRFAKVAMYVIFCRARMKTIGILHTFLPLEGNWRTYRLNWNLAIFSVQKVYMFQSVICVNCWSFWHSMKSTLKTMDSFLIVEYVVAKNATPKASNKIHNRCDMKSCQIMNWCNFPLATQWI